MDFIAFFDLLIALVLSITVHEACHAAMANFLGDPTAKNEGRLSLNPARHLDLLGTLMLFVAHFGWGKPVPYNENNLRNPRLDSALIAAAGPLSNLLTALILALVLKYVTLFSGAATFFHTWFAISLVLFIFNLIPIAPLDGSKFLRLFIPRRFMHAYNDYLERGPVLLVVLIVGDLFLKEVSGFSILGTFMGFMYDLLSFAIFVIT